MSQFSKWIKKKILSNIYMNKLKFFKQLEKQLKSCLEEYLSTKHFCWTGLDMMQAPPEIDTLAAGIINLNKREVPKKILEPPDILISGRLRVPSQGSVHHRMRSSGESEKDPVDDASSFVQIPLKNDHEEIDTPEVEAYRKQKQREFDKKEEEKKREMVAKKLADLNRKEINHQAQELAKKNFSYDINGNIIFLKNIHTDSLPKDTNYELKFNLKKPPSVIKPSFLLNLPAPLKIGKDVSKRSKLSGGQPRADPNNLEVPNQENEKSKLLENSASKTIQNQKRNLSLDHYLQLREGKNLKQNYAHIKNKTKEIFPMGSNFDKMNPDLGIMVQEKGKQKRGNLNFSTHFGKFSLSEYQSKFSKTTFNFQTFDDRESSTLKLNSQRNQMNTLSVGKMNQTKRDEILAEGNTLHLTYQTGGDATLNFNQYTTIQHVPQNRDQIKIKQNNNANSDILFMTNSGRKMESYQNSSKELLNSTQKSFLPALNREQNVRSQPTLTKFQRNTFSQGALSQAESELPKFKQLEEINQRIFYNGGQALVNDGRKGFKKQAKKPKNKKSINSILLAKKSNLSSMTQTMYSSMGEHVKTSSIFHRARPYIEKINAGNKNHLPPPPIGKTIGHGIAL